MRRMPFVLAAWLVGAAMSGCASTMTASSHMRQGFDLSRYRTFDWGPPDELPAGDPRLDQDAFFLDEVHGAIERALGERQFTLSSTSTPDLLIHIHANIDTRIDVNQTERMHGHCQINDCEEWLMEYEAGTLVVDVVDARTNQLMWRGWAQDSVSGILTDRPKMTEKLQQKVRQIMARFPRSPR
jgi:Domain of unknown function (DUF4136)